ncbi:MAG: ribonuclease P protein component [Candidatus Magasanikbacteria bacterium]
MNSLFVKKKPKGSQDKSPLIIVSKDVSKKATKRNLIKRRIRGVFRDFIESDNYDYTVIVNPEAENFSFWELKNEIEQQIK